MPTEESRQSSAVGVVGGRSGLAAAGAEYEHLWSLMGHRERVEAMRKTRTHWSVAAGEASWRGLAHLPTWRMPPGDDSPFALEIRDHADACLGLTRPGPLGASWPRNVDDTLTAALLGFGVWETWAEQVSGVWYTRAEVRDAASIYRWVADAAGRLTAVEQMPYSGGMRVMPERAVQLAVYSPQGADDWTGIGILRPVVPLYQDAVRYHSAYRAGVQRWAIPTPDITLDWDAASRCGQPVSGEWYAAELEKWAAVGRELASFERGFIARPEWVKMATYGAPITELDRLQAAIDSTDRRILSVFLAAWLMLGTSNSGGSYSLGEAQIRAAQEAADALCQWVASVWSVFIRRCIEWQFGPVPAELLPRLQADGLSAATFVDWIKSGALVSLVQAGLLTRDEPTEAAIRRAGEMEPLDTATARRAPRSPGAVVLPGARP